MSHFTVAVFTEPGGASVEELLAPYDENITLAPYIKETKAQAIQRVRQEIADYASHGAYAEWLKDPQKYESERSNTGHLEYLKNEFPQKLSYSDEDCYNEAIKYLEPEEIDADGNIISTYNPKSKWDWYSIGGRWTGALILKNGATGEKGSPGIMTPPAKDDEFDSALTSDIDFEAMEKRAKENLVPFQSCFERKLYKEAYFNEIYPTEEAYVKDKTQFTTYAVITPDGTWHASGEMGWFGFASDSPDEKRDFQSVYFEQFIKPAIEKSWSMAVVDCHI